MLDENGVPVDLHRLDLTELTEELQAVAIQDVRYGTALRMLARIGILETGVSLEKKQKAFDELQRMLHTTD